MCLKREKWEIMGKGREKESKKMTEKNVNLQQNSFNTRGPQHHEKITQKFYASDNTIAALSSMENEVDRAQQEAKKHQLTLMDMWTNQSRLHL